MFGHSWHTFLFLLFLQTSLFPYAMSVSSYFAQCPKRQLGVHKFLVAVIYLNATLMESKSCIPFRHTENWILTTDIVATGRGQNLITKTNGLHCAEDAQKYKLPEHSFVANKRKKPWNLVKHLMYEICYDRRETSESSRKAARSCEYLKGG